MRIEPFPKYNLQAAKLFFCLFIIAFQNVLSAQGTSLPIYSAIDESISLVVYNSPVTCKKNFAIQPNLKRGLRNGDELLKWKLDYIGCDGKRNTAELYTPIGLKASNADDILSFASSYSNELNIEHAVIFPSSELSNVKSINGVKDVQFVSENGRTAALRDQNDSLSYTIGLSIGNSFVESQLVGLNYELVTKGMMDQAYKKGLIELQEAEAYIQSIMAKRAELNAPALKKAGEDFLSQNKRNPGVITTASGLQYRVLSRGNGKKPKATDTVKVHYHGTTIDGVVFDSSVDRGTPAAFALNQVIPGWTEGVQLMNVGSKYEFFIPEYLAYGAQSPSAAIKPYSVLIFEVELLGVE